MFVPKLFGEASYSLTSPSVRTHVNRGVAGEAFTRSRPIFLMPPPLAMALSYPKRGPFRLQNRAKYIAYAKRRESSENTAHGSSVCIGDLPFAGSAASHI